MISEATRAWLENTQGLIVAEEGQALAELASKVPATQAIVEIGSHTGLSSCWLAAGSREGNGAHITCVDPWGPPRPKSRDDPFDLGGDGALERFQSNVAGTTQDVDREDYGDLITPLRARSVDAARMWVQPIGLLFIDAIHERWAVLQDYEAWHSHIAAGGVLAMHDYGQSYPGCKAAIDEIAATSAWRQTDLVGSLWVGRRT